MGNCYICLSENKKTHANSKESLGRFQEEIKNCNDICDEIKKEGLK